MPLFQRAARRAFACLVLLVAGGGLFRADPAHAGVVGCRTDPIVLLSDGVRVQLYSDIYDVKSNIKSVSYVLHAPVGVKVISISYPSDMTTAIPETFQFIADGRDGMFHNTAYIAANNSHIKVTSYSVATAPGGDVSKTYKKNGHANQLLTLAMKLPHIKKSAPAQPTP